MINGPYGISPSDGDLVEPSQDISVPGAGVPLTLTRTYDSGLAQTEASSGSSPGPLGYGWSYNFGMKVSLDTSTNVATVYQEDGSEVGFSPYVAGSSPAWCTGTTNYCAEAPRDVATLDHNSDGSWTFVRDTGGNETTFQFSSSGALVKETDQAGSSLTASAGTPGSGECPASASSCTVWASSASGRSLTLALDSSGRLISATDNAGNTVSYCYFGESCANGASGGGGEDLYSVTLPGSATTTYGYDASNANSSLVHDMVSEGLPSGGTVTNTYSSSGQVASQVASSGTVTLSYSGDNQSVSGGSTVVSTWPAGTSGPVPAQVVDYQFSSGALVAKTTGYGTSSAATEYFDLSPASLVATTVQDGNGNQSYDTLSGYGTGAPPLSTGDVTLSTDAMGNTTEYQYNSANQVWCQVEPSEYLDGVRCPSTEPTSPPAPSATDPYLGSTVNFYDAAGHLLATTDPLGRTTTYSYTPSGSSVPPGLQYCSVEPAEYQKGVTCPSYGATHVTGTTTSTFDPAGDLTSTTNPDGATTTYAYTDPSHPGLPTVTTGPLGDKTTVTYDAAGQVTSSTVSFGSYKATTLHAYDTAGQLYCTVSPQETAKGVTCPSSPPSPGSPPAGVTSYSYDPSGQLVQETGPTGGTTTYAYDSAGHQYCSVGPAAYAKGVTCPSTEPSTPPTPGNDPYLGATIDTYDAQGQLSQETGPLGGITLYSYDGAGNLISETVESNDPAHDPAVTTTYTYNADNQQVSQSVDPGGPDASTTLSYYDPDGNLYCSVSPKAYASGPYHCPAWQPSWAESPPAAGSLYSSSPSSSQAEAVTTSFYDADGELLQQTSPEKGTSISVYDRDGNVVCTEDAADMETTLAADPSAPYPYSCPSSPATAPPATGSGPGYETTIYDPAGQVLSTTDATGATTTYTYDAAGDILTTANPDGAVTTNCYYWETSSCASGAPAGGGQASSLYSTTSPPAEGEPKGATTTYTYLPGGAPSTKATPAGTKTDSYNAAGELTSVAYSVPAPGYASTPDVSYTYNTAGEVTTMADGTGTTTYTYNDMGDLLSSAFVAAQGSGLASGTTSYTYYSTGQRASLTYPVAPAGGSPVAHYSYDAAGQLASETDWAGKTIGFSYGPNGNTTSVSYPDGATVDNTYDLSGSMTSVKVLTSTAGPAVLGASYSLDSAERVISETDSGALAGSTAYSYDAAGRLGSVTAGPGNPAPVAYDAAGNPTGLANGSTQAFDPAQQVTETLTPNGTSTAYGYDQTGGRTSYTSGTGGYATYGYDQSGQLVSASVAGPATTYPAAVEAEHPVAYWRLDDPAGSATAADDSGGGHPLTAFGSPTFGSPGALDGDPATSVGLDGNGQYLTATSSALPDFSGNAAFSIEAWVGPLTSNANDLAVVSKFDQSSQSGWSLDLKGASVRLERWANGQEDVVSTPATEPLTANAFTQVVATYDGSQMEIYLDGSLAASAESPLAIPTLPGGTPVMVGSPGFAGSLEEVAAYASALSPAEVDAQYSAGATLAPADNVSYYYNGHGLLAGTATSSGTATNTWDTTASVPLLLSDGTNDYLYGPNGTPVEQANLTTGTPEYFVADAQGSTRALLGASGSVDATFSYDAYGNLTSQTGTATTPLLYDGQYFDQTTGFYYLRARWFDPSTDQFTTVDPLVAETGQPYAYAGDDPINSSDPSGLCSFFNIWCDVFGGGRPPVCRTAICVVSPPTTWPGLGPLDVPREAYNYINSFADHGMTTRQFQTVAYLEWLETDGPNGGAAQLTQSVVAQSAGCNPTGPNAAPQYAAYACAASAVIKYRPGQFNGAKPTVYTAEQFYQDHEYTLTYLAVALNGKLLENLDKADGMDKLYEIIDKAPEVVAMATLASTFTPAATGPAPGCGTTA